ncbi:hypothetical protein RvY_13154 [Ramazzottius varieornatus]|uniref:Centromere protein X n=1 Tax=Ramazzottius varieornatus TaxID=947166 RepID=A0A1D1VQZ4_RAMVA|nr:hypothetical protein RvY_13154 [Ramazzottius varieornatus]
MPRVSASKSAKNSGRKWAAEDNGEPADSRDGSRRDEDQTGPTPFNLSTRFKADVLKKCLSSGFEDSKTKLSNEALIMMAEALRFTVYETLARAVNQASAEQVNTVEVSHVEKILPQLMLDF